MRQGIPIHVALWLVCSLMSACGAGVQTGRIGPAIPLPVADARNACEQSEWHELAPARMVATGQTAGIGYNTTYSQVNEGVGVFKLKDEDPEELEDLWSGMQEVDLQRAHVARIEPVDAAESRTLNWSIGGLLSMGVGFGVAAATAENSETTAAVFGVTGLVAGLVCVVGALVNQPSGEDQIYANTRRELFIPDEDDIGAAARGVNRLNARRRHACGGPAPEAALPVPPTEPPRPAAPAAQPVEAPTQPLPNEDDVPANAPSAVGAPET